MTEISNRDNIAHWAKVPRKLLDDIGDEGDFARQHLLNPVLLGMAGEVSGKRILDAGCGQGYLARMLARRGARVIGIEPANTLFSYCMEREQDEPLGIQYIQADLSTFNEALEAFDIVVANMVLMDIPDWRPAFANCMRLVRDGGAFIFSLTHPCFEEPAGAYAAKGYVAVREYFTEYPIERQFGYSFHRPLSAYLRAVIDEGGIIQQVVEPQLDPALVTALPEAVRDVHVPSFVIIHAAKTG